MKRFLGRFEWVIVGLLAATAFGLGVVGHWQVLVVEGDGRHNLWDVVYKTVRLFVFEGDEATVGWPPILQVARLLAPATLTYTAAKAVWLALRERLTALRIRTMRDHVVVCGLGERGYRLARAFASKRNRVLAIDMDEDNPHVGELRACGVVVVDRNALDSLVLQSIRVSRARYVFAYTADDETNIGIARATAALVSATSRRDRPLRCFVRLSNPWLVDLLARHPLVTVAARDFEVQVSNIHQAAARQLLAKYPPDRSWRPTTAEDPPMHVLVAGFGPLGQQVVVQTALTAHYADQRAPRVTVMDSAAETVTERFRHQYPNLPLAADVQFVAQDPLTVGPDLWARLQADAPISAVYVALESDVDSVVAARTFHGLQSAPAGGSQHPFVVCLNQQTPLADLLRSDDTPIGELPIVFFEALDETCTIEAVVREQLDVLARGIHDDYLRQQRARGQTRKTAPWLAEWDVLTTAARDANRHPADHIDVKLRTVGCVRRPEDGPDLGLTPFPPDEGSLDLLARTEHRRWMAERHLSGWVYGLERDDARKHHPCLVPWDDLSEDDREKDREAVRNLPSILAGIGQKICRGQPDGILPG